jgi:hypothetical protein
MKKTDVNKQYSRKIGKVKDRSKHINGSNIII